MKASGFLDSSDDESGNEDEWKAGEEERHTERGTEEAGGGASELGEGEEGGSEGVKDAAKVPGGRKFLEDSEDEEDETNATRDTAEDDKEQEKSVNERCSVHVHLCTHYCTCILYNHIHIHTCMKCIRASLTDFYNVYHLLLCSISQEEVFGASDDDEVCVCVCVCAHACVCLCV